MELVFQLKAGLEQLNVEMGTLREVVESLKTKSVEDVYAQTLEGFNDRLTRFEGRIRGIETVLAIAEPTEQEIKAGN